MPVRQQDRAGIPIQGPPGTPGPAAAGVTLDAITAPVGPVNIAGQRLLDVADPLLGSDAINKSYADGRYMSAAKTVDQMVIASDVDFAGHKAVLLEDPSSDQDAVNKRFADATYFRVDGTSTAGGPVNLDGWKLQNVGDAVSGTDALNMRTADGRYIGVGGSLPSGLVSVFSDTTKHGDSIIFDATLNRFKAAPAQETHYGPVSFLDQATAVNDTSIKLTRPMPSEVNPLAGAWVIEGRSGNCEARKATAVSSDGLTITLAPQKSYSPGGTPGTGHTGHTQILAAGNTIRTAAQITDIRTINGSGSADDTLQITTDMPMQDVSNGDTVTIWGTTNYNWRSIGPVLTPAVDTPTATVFTIGWNGTHIAPETPAPGTAWITGRPFRHFCKHFRVGQKFNLSGTVNNNGTYTVASVDYGGAFITTVEPLVTEWASTPVYTWNIQAVHPRYSPVQYIPNRVLDNHLYGLQGDGSTDESIALQNMFWDTASVGGTSHFGRTGKGDTYCTSVPLFVPTQTTTGVGQSGIPVIEGIGAQSNWPDNSFGVLTYVDSTGHIGDEGRWIVRDLAVQMPGVDHAYGILYNGQQPSSWYNVKIQGKQNNTSTGECLVLRGAESSFFMLECNNGGIGITLDTAVIMRFYDLDIEDMSDSCFYCPPMAGGWDNVVFGFHTEQNDPGHITYKDDAGNSQITFHHAHVIPGPGPYTFYRLNPWKPTSNSPLAAFEANHIHIDSSSTNDALFYDDRATGWQYGSWSNFEAKIEHFSRTGSNSGSTLDASRDVHVYANGQVIKWGPTRTSEPFFVFQSIPGITGKHLRGDSLNAPGIFKSTYAGSAVYNLNDIVLSSGTNPLPFQSLIGATITGDLTDGDTVVRNVSSFAGIPGGSVATINGPGVTAGPATKVASINPGANQLTLSSAVSGNHVGATLVVTNVGNTPVIPAIGSTPTTWKLATTWSIDSTGMGVFNKIVLGNGLGPQILTGLGDPTGVVTAPIGSKYLAADTGSEYRNTTGLAAGWVNTSSTGGSSSSRSDKLMGALGFKGISHDWVNGSSQVIVSGTMYGSLVYLFTGDIVTNLGFLIITAQSAGISLAKVGLFFSDGTQKAVSANNTNMFSATGWHMEPLTAPFTVVTEGAYYLGVLAVAVTPPLTVALSRSATVSNSGLAGPSGIKRMVSPAGLSDAPATLGTPSSTFEIAQAWS